MCLPSWTYLILICLCCVLGPCHSFRSCASPPSLLFQMLSCPTLCKPMDCNTPGFPVLHYLLEFAQTHVYWVSDATQPSHLLSPTSPPAINLSQHQGLFQWVGSLHQVAKVLELQFQHQSFQWIFRVDFLVCSPCCPNNSQGSSPEPQFKRINSLLLSLLYGPALTTYWKTTALTASDKESAYNVGDLGLIPGLGWSPRGRRGNPFQYSCLGNPTDRGAWWATVHGVTRVGHNLGTKLLPPAVCNDGIFYR